MFSLPVHSQEMTEKLLHSNQYYEMVHVITPTNEYVRYTGDIFNNTTYNINLALSQTGADTLYMNSYGGHALESFALGYFLKENDDLNVVVDTKSVCVSACAFAVSASENLEIRNETGLYFHMPYAINLPTDKKLEDIMKGDSIVLYETIFYLISVGFSVDFIDVLVYETSRDTYMQIETLAELEKFKGVSELYNGVGEYNLKIMR